MLKYIFDQGERQTDARAILHEVFLFGANGAAHQYPGIRQDLFLVLDDGWDVPFSAKIDNPSVFGSLIPNEKRFSSYRGTPAQRLRALNEDAKRLGWRGLGLWVCPQIVGEDYNKPFNREKFIQYYTERMEWCKYADIRYWKVGGGYHASNIALRTLLVELARQIFPALILDFTSPHVPFNGDPQNGFYSYEDAPYYEEARELASISDVYRVHDILGENLSCAITLDRVVGLLSGTDTILNCEDEMYLGTALGCALGIRRCDDETEERLGEVYAAVKWQRYAPAFSGTELACSNERLVDHHRFNQEDTWYAGAYDKQFLQAAPAVVARNTPLPILQSQDHNAYVVCSQNPSGAYSIASIDCTSKTEQDADPAVLCKIEAPERIGVFGTFERLTLLPKKTVRSVILQSLFDDAKTDITTHAVQDGTIVLTKALLQSMHRATDRSAGAIMLTVTYDK